jgi:hypothetical protein
VNIWVCNIRGRAYPNPGDRLEYFCIGIANRKPFLKRDHREAGCGYYVKATEYDKALLQ